MYERMSIGGDYEALAGMRRTPRGRAAVAIALYRDIGRPPTWGERDDIRACGLTAEVPELFTEEAHAAAAARQREIELLRAAL